jgi:hypothetical protein
MRIVVRIKAQVLEKAEFTDANEHFSRFCNAESGREAGLCNSLTTGQITRSWPDGPDGRQSGPPVCAGHREAGGIRIHPMPAFILTSAEKK